MKITTRLILAAFALNAGLAANGAMAQPHIDSLNIDESKSEIELWGNFGSDNKVVVQYTPLAILRSSRTNIVASIPDSGAGSCGELVVYSDGVGSPSRTITEWAMAITSYSFHRYSDSGLDLIFDTVSLRFRMDMLQMIKKHGKDDVDFLAELSSYSRHITGGQKGIRGGGLTYGMHDDVSHGPFDVSCNLYKQTLNVNTSDPRPNFNPDFSITPVFPNPTYGGFGFSSGYLPLYGTTIAHYLPTDSVVWSQLYGPALPGPKCRVHVQAELRMREDVDSINPVILELHKFDSSFFNRTISCDWNTDSNTHFTRSARTYSFIDTVHKPVKHIEKIQVLLGDSSKSIERIDLEYRIQPTSGDPDTLIVTASATSLRLTAEGASVVGTLDTADKNQQLHLDYQHAVVSNLRNDWLMWRDTTTTGMAGSPAMTIVFNPPTQRVATAQSEAEGYAGGYLLRSKFQFLKDSGVTDLYDVLGRATSIRTITDATTLLPGLYFARVGRSVLKLLN